MPFHQPWTLITALRPFLAITVAIVFALYTLAYPPRHRTFAFFLLCVPTCYAFIHHLELTPWYSLNDTFGRMLYIWLAYMSYAFLLARAHPNIEQGTGWKERLRWAGKVLYTRHLGEYYTPASTHQAVDGKEKDPDEVAVPRRRRDPQHHLTRFAFCLRHLARAVLFLATNHIYDTHLTPPSTYPPASFLRRLPSTLSPPDLQLRAMMTWDVCISDMLYFESVYSLFAILWVGIFRLDDAPEWSLCLFGHLADCTSVRAYWGAYWHDFINASFAAHGKVLARRVLGMDRRGKRRLLENAVVFVASGLMHSLVRYVQTEGRGEVWTVAMWYGAQMLPIVIEGVVQRFWSRSGARERLRVRLGEVVVVRLERAVGYAWVLCWMFWSVSKYLLTRHAWELEELQRRYPDLFAIRREHVKIDLGG